MGKIGNFTLIELSNVTIEQENFTLKEINFKVGKGRYAILMGDTGCGKTSVIETIAGIRSIKHGAIYLNSREVTHDSPASRGLGYVPQDASLFKTMLVKDNIAFSLEVRGWEKNKKEERVKELANLLHLEKLLFRPVYGLSGGEKQRIALGRALAFHPEILLLDEPLSAVDENLRISLGQLLKDIQKHTEMTVLHVTHNPLEAKEIGDLKFEISNGKVMKVA